MNLDIDAKLDEQINYMRTEIQKLKAALEKCKTQRRKCYLGELEEYVSYSTKQIDLMDVFDKEIGEILNGK